MKKLGSYSGLFLLITGVLHSILGLVKGKDAFAGMVNDGLINSVKEDVVRNSAFWFLICGIIIILFGYTLHLYIKKLQQPAPLLLGHLLLLISIIGCLIVPASGFWLFIPQAIIIIGANKKKNEKRITE